MKASAIFAAVLLMLASTSGKTQDNLTVSGILSNQGKPFAGGLVVLQRVKDAKCARLWGSQNLPSKDARRIVESCTEELPWMNTDDHGNYSYEHLAPGWYDIRFLWFIDPVWPAGIECWTGDWAIKAGPQKDLTGKYNAFAQGKPFELKANEPRQINFDYQSQINRGPGCAPYPQSQPPISSKARVSIPGSKGALEINVGPTYWIEDFSEDGKEVQLRAMGRSDHLLITAFLKRMTFPASAERCRSEWWPQTKRGGGFQLENLDETAMKDGIARVEFIMPMFRGEKIRQKNIHAYLGGRDLCAEIHLSKVEFEPEDQQLFERVLATVRLLPDEPALSESSSIHQFFQAERSYVQDDYKAAAKHYQKALDQETEQRTMNRDQFRMLVVGLGMAAISARDPQRASAALQGAMAEDPEYPLFYFLAARIHADKGEMDECLKQLRLAYKYKDNMIPGDGPLPDPLQSDAFRRFVNDPEFVRAVREMQQR